MPVTYTDEEVERAYEEFYEDVHTEFLKFGEIINFKVCRNGASHLRGNVYVHYKCLDSAVLSYQSANGRYFAGKQVQCEFVGVTRWRVAICGEFMKSKLTTCSRGTACNFIHCFRNPGGDYEWADWDKPPPRYWVKEMAALFGYPDESGYDKKTEQRSPRLPRYYTVRSQPRNIELSSSSSRNYAEDGEDGIRSSESRWHHRGSDRKHPERHDYEQHSDVSTSREKQHSERVSVDHESDRYWSDRERGRQSYSSNLLPSCKKRKLGSRGGRSDETNTYETGADENMHENDPDPYYHHEHSRRGEKHDPGAGSKRDRHRPSSQSSTGSVMGVSISPRDRWSCEGDGGVLNSDCSDGERRRGYGEADEYGSESPRDCRRSSKHRKERREKSERSSKIEFVDERGRWEPHE